MNRKYAPQRDQTVIEASTPEEEERRQITLGYLKPSKDTPERGEVYPLTRDIYKGIPLIRGVPSWYEGANVCKGDYPAINFSKEKKNQINARTPKYWVRPKTSPLGRNTLRKKKKNHPENSQASSLVRENIIRKSAYYLKPGDPEQFLGLKPKRKKRHQSR